MNVKRITILLSSLVVALAIGLSSVSAQGPYGNGAGNTNAGGNPPRGANMGGGGMFNLPAGSTDTLPQAVIDLMIAGWKDEQHAYAVYGAVVKQFGAIRPFVNIQRSEAQHIAAWETLFARYNIPIPAVPTVEVPSLTSVSAACSVAAAAEIANFELYDTMKSAFASYPDLAYVAQTLRDVSEFNHLPAFQRC